MMYDTGHLVRFLKRLLISQLLLGCVFVAVGFAVNFLQVFLLPLRWFGCVDTQRSLNQKLTYLHWIILPAVAQWWADIRVRVHCSKENLQRLGKESAILLMNHKGQLDWVALWTLAENYDIMQNLKSVAKSSLWYVPLVGPSFWLNEFIFLERNYAKDKEVLATCVKEYLSIKYNYWLTLFCEGTRFTPAKHKASIQFALKNGLKPLKHHLVPRTKGFTSIVEGFRQSGQPVYDFTVCFNRGREYTLTDYISGESLSADIFVRRIAMDEIPRGEAESAKYLHKLYQEKDELCEFFEKNGQFPSGPVDERYRDYATVTIPKKTRSLAWLLFWAAAVLIPLYYLMAWAFSCGSWIHCTAAVALLFVLSVSYRAMVTITSTNSSYGERSGSAKILEESWNPAKG